MGGRFGKVYMGEFRRRLDNRDLESPSMRTQPLAQQSHILRSRHGDSFPLGTAVTIADGLGREFRFRLSVRYLDLWPFPQIMVSKLQVLDGE